MNEYVNYIFTIDITRYTCVSTSYCYQLVKHLHKNIIAFFTSTLFVSSTTRKNWVILLFLYTFLYKQVLYGIQ